MPRHPDFEKIYQAFMWRYCKDQIECEVGKSNYFAWQNKLGLDDTKPYQYPQETREKFSWIKPHMELIKEDDQAKYFKVEALFPLSSMNRNVYTRDELTKACRTLIGKPVNLNHTNEVLPEVQIVDADYEDDTVECLDRIERNSKALQMIENGDILQVSIEAACLRGTEETPDGSVCKGQIFTGKALLTKDVLPGVPLTRIMPVEKLVESFTVTGVTNLSEKGKQESKPENSGQQARQNAVDKNDPERPFIFALEAWLAKNTEEDYPWDQCIADHKAHGYDDDSAARICAAIKNRSVAHSLQNGLAKTTEEAVDLVAKNVKENPYLSYLAGLLVQKPKESQEKTKPPPEPQRRKEEPKNEPCKCVLTQEGFWARFHQLRSEGASKSEAFRLVSMEVIAAASKKSKS
jgi:hypothetical protein